MDWADIIVQEVNKAEKSTRPKRNVKKLFEYLKEKENEESVSDGPNWSEDLENSQSEESTDDHSVKLSVQRTKRKKYNVILEEATDVEDYRFECIYCDFKTTSRKLWMAHLDYKDRSRRKLILNPGKTVESENIGSKLHEKVDLDEKITCHKDINDLKQTVLGVGEIQSQDTLESENIEPKLYEEIDLDETIICDKDTNDMKSEDIEAKLHEEIDLNEEITCHEDTDDLREIEVDVVEEQSEETPESEYIEPKLHEEIDLDENKKATEIYTKDSEIITEKVDADWADINVEEIKETEDATVTKIGKSRHRIRLHRKSHLPENGRKCINCDACNYKIKRRRNYNRYYRRRAGRNKSYWFNCGLCPYQNEDLEDMRNHVKKIHGLEKKYIHSSIGKSDEKYKQDEYEEKSCFQVVPESEVKRPYNCLFCNHAATNHEMILEHISIHHNLVKIVKYKSWVP